MSKHMIIEVIDTSKYWMKATGEVLLIEEMDSDHLRNCIKFLMGFVSDECTLPKDLPRIETAIIMLNILKSRNEATNERIEALYHDNSKKSKFKSREFLKRMGAYL